MILRQFRFEVYIRILVVAGINAVQMLFWAAVMNGMLAPPLIFVIVLLTRDLAVFAGAWGWT